MATYYISKGGDDGNAGTGPGAAAAWLTWAKAVAVVAAGDTVYVGPGRYGERVTLATAGGVATVITWIGDPDCQYLTSDTPGIVRVTGCDANELATANTVFNFNGKDYNTVKDIWVDGSTDAYGVTAGAGNGRICERVKVHGCSGGITGGTNKFCSIITGSNTESGIFQGTNTACIVMRGSTAADSAAYRGGTSTNCIAITGGDSPTFYQETTVNCIGIGGRSTGSFREGTHTNPIALLGGYGFYGLGSAITLTNPVAIGCNYGFYGTNAGDKLGTATAKAVWCKAASGGEVTHAVTSGAAILWDLLPLLAALEPLVPGFLQNNGTNVGAPSVDILGRVRPMGTGTTDAGPWELSTVTHHWTAGSYSAVAPGIKITLKGQQIFKVPATAGTSISVAVACKHVDTTGDKPQLILGRIGTDGTFTAIDTDTAAVTTDWQTLTVTATPDVDELLEARLYARDTTAGAYTLFSDPVVG